MRVTREMHNRCNAAYFALEASNPQMAARAMRRDGTPITDPAEIEMGRKLFALSAVAGAFTTGDSPSRSDLKLAQSLIA